ncbi:hypothetical protein phytr_8520 [Candidatus Phycorickettsia trachydisci]|uniref:Uncharacterized protein n=1 Tax=Candidatus Phycorickettsia trachydisci TaxID=2115978 RepID=A0A2P1P948_9RICK|nr:hypothetical protein [Candidatus Phycorickettsia trachydisci]AVP87784.1 hypothetical protein phytr_8520 [Candidatus Phycorickettsia trachydisci]
MNFWFDIGLISKYGFTRYRKAKLLAKAVEKANKPDGCFHKSQYWLKIAEKLSADESVPTEYVKVRVMMKSLEKGYLNLVLNLYGQPELVPSKEMQKRIADLYQDLLLLHTGNPISLGSIERMHQLIDVISAFYIIRFANLEDNSQKSSKEYLKLLSLNNKRLNMEKPEAIDNMIDKIVNTKFDVPESAKDGLVNLVKLIPIQNIAEKYHQGFMPEVNIKKIFDKRYPFDYVKDDSSWDREINAWGILGGSQYLIDKQISQTIKTPILSKKPIKFRQIKEIYKKVLEFKTQGIDPNVVAIKLQIEVIYLRNDDILEIYNVISEECPEPDVLYSRSTKSLGLSQELVDYIKPTSPSGLSSPKNKVTPKHLEDFLISNSPKGYSSDDGQDICLNAKKSHRFKNDSLKRERDSSDNNSPIHNKSFTRMYASDEINDGSNTQHNNSPVKKSVSIKIDPVHGVGHMIYCSPASHKEPDALSILGASDDMSEEFL